VRDTDGDRVSKGQHAWLISSPSCSQTAREPEDVYIVGDPEAVA